MAAVGAREPAAGDTVASTSAFAGGSVPCSLVGADLCHEHFYTVELLLSAFTLTELFCDVGIDDTFTGLKTISRLWGAEVYFKFVDHRQSLQ